MATHQQSLKRGREQTEQTSSWVARAEESYLRAWDPSTAAYVTSHPRAVRAVAPNHCPQ